MKKRTKYTIGLTLALGAVVAAAALLPACNPVDERNFAYDGSTRVVAGSAAPARVPHKPVTAPALSDVGAIVQPLAECVSFYVESEASDFFLRELGDPRGKDEVDCGDDSLYYLDQTWNCNVFGVNYTVVRYSRDDEAAREVRRTVIADDKSPSWSFQCKYNSECTQIRCKVL